MQQYVNLIDHTKLALLHRFIQKGELQTYHKLYEILEEISQKLIQLKEYNVEELLEVLTKEYVEQIRMFVEKGVTPGISAGITTYNGPEINVYYGKTSENKTAKPIDETVRFDSASVTKMYTALQYLWKHYNFVYSLDEKINHINPEFQQNTTLRELLSFYHVFHTDGKLEQVCSKEEEAISLLKRAKIIKRCTFLYSDIPYMIASLIDPKFKTDFEEIFGNKIGLKQTGYTINEKDVITGGAMNELTKVHDLKARILSYAGHAGIYTTTHDSLKLFKYFIQVGMQYAIAIDMTKTFFSNGFVTSIDGSLSCQSSLEKINGEEVERLKPIWVNKAMGVYVKHPLGLFKTDVHTYQSKYAFAAVGFTGCWLNYDFANEMAVNIFTNPLSGCIDGKKPKDYVYTLDALKKKSLETAIALQFAQTVFETYYEKSNDFQKRYIK